MDQIELTVSNREILGKKVRFLRRQGITPAHLFGHGIESMALQCDTVGLRHVLAEAGKTRLINLKVDSEKKSHTAMVREVQLEPRTGEIIHVDFYQVQMAEAIKVEVPIILIGEAPALKQKENMLVHELSTLTVECLPAKIPDSIEVDITSLTEADQAVRVKDIKLDEGVSILHDPEVFLARISSRPREEVEEAVEEEVVEAPEVAAAGEEPAKEE